MKRKLVTILLLLGILSTSLIGCGNNKNIILDEYGVPIEEVSNKEYTNTETPTKIKINKSYIVSNEKGTYLALETIAPSNISEDSRNLRARVTSINENGIEKEIEDNFAHFFVANPASWNEVRTIFKHSKNDKLLVFNVSWDGYEPNCSYKIELYTTYSDENTPIQSDEYIVSSSEIEEFTQDEFIEYMTDKTFDSIKETNTITFDGIELKFVALDVMGDSYALTFNAKNIGNKTTEEKLCRIQAVTKNNISVYNLGHAPVLGIDELAPGEKLEQIGFIVDNINRFDESSNQIGSELLIEVVYDNTNGEEDVKYFKIQY